MLANGLSDLKKFRVLLPALLASIGAASGPFLDRAETCRAVATGMASRFGFVEAGAFEKLSAFAWEHGGWLMADILRATVIGGAVFVGLLVLALLPRRGIFWVAAAGVFSAGLWNAYTKAPGNLRDPRLLAPWSLLERANAAGGRIFFDPNSLFHAAAVIPEKIEPGSSLEISARLASSPVEWRAEDRNTPFSAVVLSGRNELAGPLAQMLRELPGWSLAFTDNYGLLFVRGDRDLDSPNKKSAKALFPNSRDRAVYLARSAGILHAAGKPESARELLRTAIEMDDKNSEVQASAALLAANEGRWRECQKAAQAALDLDPRSIQAPYLLALAFLESGVVAKAGQQIHPLAESHPNDAAILGLQARIAQANNDPSTEISALEKLLGIHKRTGMPAGALHARLGEAWASMGFPEQALENFRFALAENPTPEQRKHLEESIKVIEASRR